MMKYKVCPICGTKNPPTVLECVNCESDLSSIKIVDEETVQLKEQPKQDADAVRLVRICDCGRANPVNVRKCLSCGEDISDITPMPACDEQKSSYILEALDGDYRYEVKDGSVTVGRESEMSDYLSGRDYVSRKHAVIQTENEKLYITNISKTNRTYVNNRLIPDCRTELHDGDEIGLGGNCQNGARQERAAYFRIREMPCT